MNDQTLTLLDLLAKGSAVTLLGFGCIAFMRRHSAAQRSLAWLAVFSAMLVLPLAVFVRPVWTIDVPVVKQRVLMVNDTPPSVVETSEISVPISMPVPNAVVAPAWTIWQWLAASYVTGMVLVLGFRLIGSWQLWWLQQIATSPDARIQEAVTRLEKFIGIRRRIRVLQSNRITVPMTWGIFKPVLMLPSACSAWTDADLRSALEHELAHIRHLDASRRLLATFVSALWWPHPLVWIANKSWRLEQERACDDAVVRSGSDAARYAAQLLDAAQSLRLGSFQSAAALVMAMPSGLETRLHSILGANVNRSAAGRAAFFITAAAGLFVVTICAVCQAQTEASPKPGGQMIYITTKFVEAPVAVAKLPALRRAMEGNPVTLSDTEMLELIRQLTQNKGVNLMSAPIVTTRSGQKATVEVVREFIYPTEFKDGNEDITPTTFDMMPIGVIVGMDASIQSDGVIQLKPVSAKVNEFLGFMVGGRENLDADGRLDDTRKFTGRANMVPESKESGGIGSVTNITEKMKSLKQGEVKKGEVSKPVFRTMKWSGDVSLKQGEWMISCLKTENDAGEKDGKRVWFFVSAKEMKADEAKAAQSAVPAKADSPWVTILGEVKRQGRYNLTTGMTLNDLITQCLGVSDFADINRVKLTRGTGETKQTLDLSLPKDAATPLMAGDSVLVSELKTTASDQAVSAIVERASQIIFPHVHFKDAKLSEALDFLRVKSKELDPDKVGVNLILKPGTPDVASISLDLTNVPLNEVLRYVTMLSGTKFVIEPSAVTVRAAAAGGAGDKMLTRFYAVPSTLLDTEKSAKNWLTAKGISFPDGAIAVFNPATSRLIVKNTAPELDKVEAVIVKLGVPTKTPEPPLPAIVKRAQAIIFPQIELNGATVDEVVEFLQVKNRQFDPDKKGVNIVLKKSEVKNTELVSLNLKRIPLWEALRYVSELAGMKLEAGEDAIVIRPISPGEGSAK